MNNEEVERVFKEKLNELFPSLPTRNSITWGSQDENGKTSFGPINSMLPSSNKSFADSPYYSTENKFVHFTSITALQSIAESKTLRLYNLHNMDDPLEFMYAARLLKTPEEEIRQSKDGQFIISGCNKSIFTAKNAKEEFDMWRLYGKNGAGVAIIFSIENDRNKWSDFHFAPVTYGAEDNSKFTEFFD